MTACTHYHGNAGNHIKKGCCEIYQSDSKWTGQFRSWPSITCRTDPKPGAESDAQKPGRIMIIFGDDIPAFILQSKLTTDFHARDSSDADHRGEAVFDTAEDGERAVITDAIGNGPVIGKPEPQTFVSAAD